MSRPASKISVIRADPTVPHHSGVLFVQAVPLSTKQAFKAACAKKGKTMRDVLIAYMRIYAEHAEDTGIGPEL